MSLLESISRIVSSVVGKATEGAYRPGPYYLPVTHGWLPVDVRHNTKINREQLARWAERQ